MYVQSDTLLLADVFENFRNMCIEIYGLDPTHFLSAPELAWQSCLKKKQVRLELLTDVDMLLMVEEGIRGGICHAIHRQARANNKYMKDYNKDEEQSFLEYKDSFEWEENILKFNEDFIKNYDEDSNKGHILTVDVEYPKNVLDLHSDLPFLPERMKINKFSKLVCCLYDKNSYVVHIIALNMH